MAMNAEIHLASILPELTDGNLPCYLAVLPRCVTSQERLAVSSRRDNAPSHDRKRQSSRSLSRQTVRQGCEDAEKGLAR